MGVAPHREEPHHVRAGASLIRFPPRGGHWKLGAQSPPWGLGTRSSRGGRAGQVMCPLHLIPCFLLLFAFLGVGRAWRLTAVWCVTSGSPSLPVCFSCHMAPGLLVRCHGRKQARLQEMFLIYSGVVKENVIPLPFHQSMVGWKWKASQAGSLLGWAELLTADLRGVWGRAPGELDRIKGVAFRTFSFKANVFIKKTSGLQGMQKL